ncbi:AAA family ATPase [Actinoplanes sp. TBRC 11911]|uniref:helix-turn-helix transcriptional regulator n=1 Tax=Actinoplanes sp. TBRC 11911 TaxID=2729386 RepID=UPI00145E6D8F|nr:LuxR family transcriptional regulator [Actinoplanes sp. TBRC 11911]NMO50026.1 AAA family ATPase [Actinoplanes sp. TBRC 11911]
MTAAQIPPLVGRDEEVGVIDRLLTRAGAGQGGAVVLRGPAGIGKTVLLDYAATRAGPARVLRVVGIERESDLAFAGLHELVLPITGVLHDLPVAQTDALGTVLGLPPAGEIDRFRISVQLLGLLAAVAPLLVLVDDVQWLDRPSADALLFVARRLDAEPIAMLFAVRDGFDHLGIPDVPIGGLTESAAEDLLARSATGLAPSVRRRLLAEADGNPLALLELPRSLSAGQLHGRDALPDRIPLTPLLGRLFRQPIRRLSHAARTAVLLAAADNTGDTAVVLRAAARLGLPPDALDAAETAALIRTDGGRLTFRHPLVRATVYDGATLTERRAAHTALAEALIGDDADRRVWQQAMAAIDPDEAIAAELDESAHRSTRRAAHASAAAALLRAAELSAAGPERTRRLAGAAEAAWAAGEPDKAQAAVDRALPHAEGELYARLLRLSGVIAARNGHLRDACDRLLEAARATADPPRILETLIEAAGPAFSLGDASRLGEIGERAGAVATATSRDLLIARLVQGHAKLLAGDYQPAYRLLADALAHAGHVDDPRALIWAARAASLSDSMGCGVAYANLGVDLARRRGLVGLLPLALAQQSAELIGVGDYDLAYATASEGERLATELGQGRATHLVHMATVAAVRGRVDEAYRQGEEALALAQRSGSTYHAAGARMALGHADGGAGRVAEAAERMLVVTDIDDPEFNPVIGFAAMPDAIETLLRAERGDFAMRRLTALTRWVSAAPTDARRALLARCEALLERRPPDEAFADALALGGALFPVQRARTQLLYGEWLRRRRRRQEARPHLRAAYETFSGVGAGPLAERAAVELRATGERLTPRDPAAMDRLTPQELQIATLVSQGMQNREIASVLFISPRTVEYHLRKVFAKLGIASRTDLVRGGTGVAASPSEAPRPAT